MSELNLFATFPISNTYNLPVGDNQFDFITGEVIAADDTVLPMAKRTNREEPLKYLWIDCASDVNVEVRFHGDVQYKGRVASDGFYFNDLTYDELIITTTAITATQIIGSSSPIAGVGGGSGGGATGADVETVEADIDGKEALTTNSLSYGRTSAGVTSPIDASPANTARTIATTVQASQHVDATGKVQPAGEVVTNPVHTAIGDGAQTIDVETLEADIDTKNAGTTNSLIYGREAAGVTHPVAIDANGVVSVNDINDPEVATTPVIYNVTMTNLDTEYSQALPANTKIVSFRCQDVGFDTRYAFETGKVATPTVPYRNLFAGEERTVEGLNLAAVTLYFACDVGAKIMEIECWT